MLKKVSRRNRIEGLSPAVTSPVEDNILFVETVKAKNERSQEKHTPPARTHVISHIFTHGWGVDPLKEAICWMMIFRKLYK
jgi:hypothetical protein